jgi:hypothetical protein
MTDDTPEPTDRTAPSGTKEKALAATTVAVGAGAGAAAAVGTAAAQEDGEAVVPGHSYYPDVDFEVLVELESGTRDTVLEGYDDEFDTLSDWDAYIISIEANGTGVHLGHLFADEDEIEDISEGDTGTFDTDASVRNADLNLVEVNPGL